MTLAEDAIKFEERDIRLNLAAERWPNACPPGWEKHGLRLFRRFERNGAHLEESIIRFPSAPIYGTHRKFAYQLQLPRVNYHTFRLIRNQRARPLEKIYFICNGMNELDSMGFYYDLASHLINKDEGAACLLRPLPGHLTRFPLPSMFAEKPLDRYLSDAGDLFRQFLRYMVETRWLLSVLTPLRTYRTASGLELLASGDEPGADAARSRSTPAFLAQAITGEWQAMMDASCVALSKVTPVNDEMVGAPVSAAAVERIISEIRDFVGWKAVEGATYDDGPDRLPPPTFHAVGYSLGGFFAQAIFFAWPFALSTCTTLGAGGALRSVAPSAFAHREEWRYVLYCLRYEIESALLKGTLALSNNAVAGLDRHCFAGFLQIFYEVFLQEDAERYRTRLAEYVSRLLFVVGGSDPIVQPKNVLEASPSCGINLVEVANLGHFVAKAQGEWKKFWLPAVARLTREFSKRGEDVHCETLFKNWWQRENDEWYPKPG